MKNTKKLLIFISAITVLIATLFSVAVSAVVAGEGTSIDEYTSKKVTAYYSFEDGKKVELVRGSGGIFGTNNSRPAANDIYTGILSLNYFGIDYYNNNGDNKHCYAEPTVGDLNNVELTPANGYVAEFDIAFFSKATNVIANVKDKDGFDVTVIVKEYLYVHVLDEYGNYKVDANGKYVFEQEVDENGELVYEPVYVQATDENGTLVYEPVFNENKKVINATPVYETNEDGTPKQAVDANGELVFAPVYVKQLDENGEPILVNKTVQGAFDGISGSFAVQMQNDPATQNKGAVNLFSFTTDKASRRVTMTISGTNMAEIPDADKTHVFYADQWLHVTIQYDAQAMLTYIYVGRDNSVFTLSNGDVVEGRRLVGTLATQGINHEAGGISVPIYPLTFRLGSSTTQGEVALDNFIGYQGTTIHNPTYLTDLVLYQRFLYVANVLADENVVATDRYQAYQYMKTDVNMQKVFAGSSYGVDSQGNEIKLSSLTQQEVAALGDARAVYTTFYNDETDKANDGVYDQLVADVKTRNVEVYKQYVDLAVALPRLIDNVETRELRVSLAENFVANAGSLIDTSSEVFIECRAQLAAIKATLEGDANAYEFVRLMNIFNNSAAYGASLARLQAHFNNAKAYFDDITDYNVFESITESQSSYTALKTAVESYMDAATVMSNKTNEVNSVRFISIVNIMKEKTSGSWANDGEEIEDLWYRAYQILISGEYDADYEGFASAKKVFDLAHDYFWNKLQAENIAHLTEKLDSYNEADKLYIDKAGICTYVDRYLEFNAVDIDFDNETIKSIIARNEAYKLQLETLVGDYKNLLVQNTTKFINVMKRAAEYDSYKDLKPLFDQATEYYYTMNIEGEGIDECVAQYNALAMTMSAIEADSGMFVAIVNGKLGYTALADITDRAELYRSLTACYACLENLDLTYEGAADAKAIYDAEYAEYTNATNVFNAQISEASNVAYAARGNWDIDAIVVIVKNLIDMIKE